MAEFLLRAFVVGFVAAGLCLAGEPSAHRAVIALKEGAAVSADVIELRDVATLGEGIPPQVAQLRLGNAPWPGHAREISRVLVKVRLVSAGFELSRFEFAGSDTCVVELESLRVEPEEIVAAARSYLESFFPQDGPDVRVELLRKVAPALVPAGGGRPQLQPALSGYGPPIGNVRVDVDVVRDGKRLKRIPVSFSVRLYRRVAVAREKIAPGDRLSTGNVAFARREITSVRGACVRAMDELKGKVAVRTIQPGQVITRRALSDAEPPVVIEANQRVFLVVRTQGLRATALGKSLSRARKGQVVAAKNLTTGKEVVGVAVADSTIQIFMGEPSHAR